MKLRFFLKALGSLFKTTKSRVSFQINQMFVIPQFGKISDPYQWIKFAIEKILSLNRTSINRIYWISNTLCCAWKAKWREPFFGHKWRGNLIRAMSLWCGAILFFFLLIFHERFNSFNHKFSQFTISKFETLFK